MTNKTPEQRALRMMDDFCNEHSEEGLMAALVKNIREAEANALRQAAEAAEKAMPSVTGRICAQAIRSLLPKEEGKAPDAPR